MTKRAILVLIVTAALATGVGVPPVAAGPGLTLSVTGGDLGPGGTTVVLSGRYACGPFASGLPDRGVIDLTVQRVRAGQTVTAYGYLEPTVCDGTHQPFAATLTITSSVPLRTGSATWSGSGYVEGDTGLQHVFVAPTAISLTR